jgi:small subunit ribosomal protein S3
MGQKVHPESMRVGYIHDWKSNWFNERHFSDFLIEDVRIRDHITNKLAHAGLSDITIRKDAGEVEINIHTAPARHRDRQVRLRGRRAAA